MQQVLKVLKIGGVFFQDQYMLPHITNIIRHEMDGGSKLMVVVSAMGHSTDNLLALMDGGRHNPVSRDMLLSTGETVAAALLADALVKDGVLAQPFTGGQSGIVTDGRFGDASITDIKTERLRKFLKKNDVAVVAGFQGETKSGDITTLGRNGSDTTAFYLTYYFNALSCTLYKDVNGVYDKNPKDHPDARLYRYLNYKDVLNGETSGIIHEKALKLCGKMFAEQNPEIIIRNFNLSQTQFTTICKKQTEFYK
ncbi:MAG: aspartate kinase [Rickettsiales bacterium]|jgi:aspartate kinase|nr:aspartate kinase [Rickettsiales bacterium]